MDKQTLYQVIREEVLKAAAHQAAKGPFMLSGRGHEARVSLDRTMASILRQCSIPRVRISGFGAFNFYPARVFVKAKASLRARLGWSPFEVTRQGEVYFVGQPSQTMTDAPT